MPKQIITTENLQGLFNYDYFQIDTIKNIIDFILVNNDVIKQNIDYTEFVDKLISSQNIDPNQRALFDNFFMNISQSESSFKKNIVTKSNDGNDIVFEIRGIRTSEDKNKILCAIVTNNKCDDLSGTLDTLTKVYQRSYIVKYVKELIEEGHEFALLMLDVDLFKEINDTYGHMVGDIVLFEVAQAVKRILKNDGIIGRIGGDEFLIAYKTNSDYNSIWQKCREIRSEIDSLNSHIHKVNTLSATIGASYFPKDGNNYETLFLKADLALYRGKRKGRNCFVIYDEEKCGVLEKENVIKYNNNYQNIEAVANDTNIVSAVFDILTRDIQINKNIEEAIRILGTYLLIDRITLICRNALSDEYSILTEWTTTGSDEYKNNIVLNRQYLEIWKDCFDSNGVYRQNNIELKDTKTLLREALAKENTRAVIAFDLKNDVNHFGSIRFDMCHKSRLWTQSDLFTLLLFSKLLTTTLNKMIEQKRYEHQIQHDDITGLFNFTKFAKSVDYILKTNIDTKYVLMYLNIRNFKIINDQLGYNTGNLVLKQLGLLLKTETPESSIQARISADRFLLFFEYKDEKEIKEIFDRISVKMTNKHADGFYTLSSIVINAGAYLIQKNDRIEYAIDKSNLARKASNDAVTSRLTIFEQKHLASIALKQDIESHMFEGLNNNEFLIYLQPKVNMSTHEIIGAEALSRWNYKFQKMIYPNDFIPIFEENGFIVDLDFHVFKKVCEFIRDLYTNNLMVYPISVNMSRFQLNFSKYIETIEKIRNQYGVKSSDIEIEITESMYVGNTEKISELIKNLHLIGYKVSMDDFGSGYSNLSLLSEVDFDVLKLDREFFKYSGSKKNEMIIESIVELAKKLKMSLICEGVETIEQAELLNQMGCFLAQGYLYGKPIAIEEFKKNYIYKKEEFKGDILI